MPHTTVLGIETSCDETGRGAGPCRRHGCAAAARAGAAQPGRHARRAYGGVVPELASRDHIRRVLPLLRDVLRRGGTSLSAVDVVAYTRGPGLAGALLVGAGVACALAAALERPALGVHHLEGHLLSPFLSADPPEFPFIALLVSGGHTQLLQRRRRRPLRAPRRHDRRRRRRGVRQVGQAARTRLSGRSGAGTAGRVRRSDAFALPRPLLRRAIARLLVRRPEDGRAQPRREARLDLRAGARRSRGVDAGSDRRRARPQVDGSARGDAACDRLVVAGGVGANAALRERLVANASKRGPRVHFPELALCTDNGAMIALAGGDARCSAASPRRTPTAPSTCDHAGRRSPPEPPMPSLRPLIDALPGSKIREVANAGIGRSDVLAFWFGESDETTPEFIREAADALAAATARPSIRTTSACPSCARRSPPTSATFHPPVGSDRIAVTSSGVNALMLAMQALVDAGDEVVAVVPVWPNLTAQPAILGATRDPLCAARPRARATGHSTSPRCARRHRAHARAARQLAQQPDRLDADARRAAERSSTIAAAPAPGSSPTRSTSGSFTARASRRRLRAELSRHRRRRRSPDRRAQLLEELPDDRLAPRLARAAGRCCSRTGQADRVQHLVRAGVRAARRPRRRSPHAASFRSRARRAPARLPRHAACRACRRCPACRSRRPRAACMRSSASPGSDDSLAFAKRLVADAGARPRPGRRVRPRRARAGCAGASRRATRRGWIEGVRPARLAAARAIISGLAALCSEQSTTPVGFTGDRKSSPETAAPLPMPALGSTRGNEMPATAEHKAEIVKAQRPCRQRHRIDRGASRLAHRPHQRAHAALQDPSEGPPWPARPAEDGQPQRRACSRT